MDGQPPQMPPEGQEDPGELFPRFEPGEPAVASRPATGAQPYRGGGQANPWLVGMAVAVVLAAISIVAFGLFAPQDTTTAGTTATTAPGDGTDTTLPGGGTDTTVPAGGTDTTVPGDGTGATLPDTGEPPAITPVGNPINVNELTMSSNDIGPLDFGADGDEVLGKLVATFGEPTSDTGFTVGTGAFGECPGDSIRVVQWGPLNVVVRGEVGNSQFVSYRIDLKFGGITHPTTDIRTLSGIRVGDTVGDLQTTYSDFVIDFVVDADAGLVFELRTDRGGALLLWGPVDSQEESALVTGIYSPDSCSA